MFLVHPAGYMQKTSFSGVSLKDFIIQGSKDGTTWVDLTDILTMQNIQGTAIYTDSYGSWLTSYNYIGNITKNNDEYIYYRVVKNGEAYYNTICGFYRVNFYGFNLSYEYYDENEPYELFEKEMKEFNPLKQNNKDDALDAVAGCLLAEPVRLSSFQYSPKNFSEWRF